MGIGDPRKFFTRNFFTTKKIQTKIFQTTVYYKPLENNIFMYTVVCIQYSLIEQHLMIGEIIVATPNQIMSQKPTHLIAVSVYGMW